MELKCPMCGGTEFDSPRRLWMGFTSAEYLLPGWSPWLVRWDRRLRIRGRACLTCGHVTMALDPDELRRKLAKL